MFDPRRLEISRRRICECNARRAMHLHNCAKLPNMGREPATLTPVTQIIAQLTKWPGAKTAPPFSQTQNGMAARDARRKRPPFLQTLNGTGRPRYRQREISPFACKAPKRNHFLNYRNIGPAQGADRDTYKGEYAPLSVRRLIEICFCNYRNRGPARRIGRDTDKGKYPLVCKASIRIFFLIIGTAALHGVATTIPTKGNIRLCLHVV